MIENFLPIFSLFQVTFYGLAHLAIDIFRNEPLIYNWQLLSLIVNTVFMMVSPKHFILQNSEYAKVDKIHFQNNTLDTSIHSEELTEAIGKAKRRLLSFQRNNDTSND